MARGRGGRTPPWSLNARLVAWCSTTSPLFIVPDVLGGGDQHEAEPALPLPVGAQRADRRDHVAGRFRDAVLHLDARVHAALQAGAYLPRTFSGDSSPPPRALDRCVPPADSQAKDMSGKHVCKQALLELFGIAPEYANRPVIGIVSRFADQKGFDLIAEKALELMKEDVSLVVLGSGDRKYEELFLAMANTFPGRVGVKIAYDNEIAHKIEAGADMFLMPSRYEPCGLNQIYSLKYGTVPVVRATGGLDDTVEPFDLEHGTGTGFKFAEYSGNAMMYAIRQALHHCTDERIWRRIQLNGMAKDFSWKGPAAEYAKVYEAALTLRGAGQASRNQLGVATSN